MSDPAAEGTAGRDEPVAAGTERLGPPGGGHAWDRSVVGWHVAFWLLLGLALLALLAGDEARGWQLALGVAVLAALAVAYHVLGRPAVMRGARGRGLGYVVVLATALPTLFWLTDGDLSFLLFLGYTQVWVILDGRLAGALATVGLSVATAAGFVAAFGTSPEALRAIGVSVLVGMLFSLTLGLWITQVIHESADRAELIEQLGAARSELAEAERAAGAAAERERLARDIHDTLAQGFTSIVMLSQVARRALERPPHGDAPAGSAEARERLAAIEEVARTNLAEARALVAAFSPVELRDRDLTAALRRLGERFAAETGLDVAVEVEPGAAEDLPAEGAVVLLRAAQEGLANVRRHAAASAVTLGLRADGGRVTLEVRDDGVGFDPPGATGEQPAGPGGYGLPGLRARAGDVGGALELAARPGAGTRLRVAVPAS